MARKDVRGTVVGWFILMQFYSLLLGFLADHGNGRAYVTMLCPSVCRL